MLAFIVTLQSFIADRKNDDKGATAVEYGLMVGLIAAVIVVTVAALGTSLDGLFNSVGGILDRDAGTITTNTP